MTDKTFLDRAYDLPDAAATARFYDDWAASYDAEVAGNGYATPARCAAALAGVLADPATPILDVGCGTGLSGLALRAAGMSTVDGTDLSPEMLAQAAERGVYRRLFPQDINAPLPVSPGTYGAASAVGVINPGHAPPETVSAILAILPPGGALVLSLNDHALAVPAYPAAIETAVTAGLATRVFSQHGPHLPGIGLESTVTVLVRC